MTKAIREFLMQNTVHFILQGKGGIGKTLVSTIVAQ